MARNDKVVMNKNAENDDGDETRCALRWFEFVLLSVILGRRRLSPSCHAYIRKEDNRDKVIINHTRAFTVNKSIRLHTWTKWLGLFLVQLTARRCTLTLSIASVDFYDSVMRDVIHQATPYVVPVSDDLSSVARSRREADYQDMVQQDRLFY